MKPLLNTYPFVKLAKHLNLNTPPPKTEHFLY